MTKSQAAFILSCYRLFDISKRVYFWTFTFKHVWPDWWYPPAWNGFAKEVRNLYGQFCCGMRVIEIHPGGHGLHYHLLVNKRMSIHFIKRIGAKWGMGRISVNRIPADRGCVIYLSKYLGKDFAGKLHGVKRWGTFGGFHHVKYKNIIIESDYMTCRRKHLPNKILIGYEELLRRAFEIHGEPGFIKCLNRIKNGHIASACVMVSSNVAITEKGGLKYEINAVRYMREWRNRRGRIPFIVARNQTISI